MAPDFRTRMGEATYRFRPSLRSADQRFSITENALIVPFGTVPLLDIAEVRVFTTPGLRSVYGALAPAARRCTIRCRNGQKISLSSLHLLSLGRFEDRSTTYVPFVRALIGNIRAHSPVVRLAAGMPPVTWWCLMLVFAALLLVLAAIVILGGVGSAIERQLTGGTAFILLALAFIAIGPASYLRALWRSRPHPLDPANDEI